MTTSTLKRRDWLKRASAVSLPAWQAASVQASSSFPQRAVRVIVPYAVGVGPDVVARALVEPLARTWNHPVVIDNRPGASGIIAFAEARRAPTDGHTLFVADTATMVVNPLIHRELPYDPERDLTPLTLLFRATFALLTGGRSRFHNAKHMLDEAAREPRRVTYASLGNGHASQVAIETLARAANVQLLHIPFKDAGALFTAVASGDVDFTAFSMNTVAGLIASGKLRALAVAARTRLKDHPALETLAEQGAPDIEMRPWAGLVTIAGTPPEVLAQLQQALMQRMASTPLRREVEAMGFELLPSTAQAFEAQVLADRALYEPLVREGRVSRL